MASSFLDTVCMVLSAECFRIDEIWFREVGFWIITQWPRKQYKFDGLNIHCYIMEFCWEFTIHIPFSFFILVYFSGIRILSSSSNNLLVPFLSKLQEILCARTTGSGKG